jgi:probable HAF family extracellular repeat protein
MEGIQMKTISSGLSALALVAWTGLASAQVYSVTELGSLGGTQGSFTNWGSVNDSGQVTGYSYLAGNQSYAAFIYENGQFLNLGAATNAQGYGINGSGQIAGASAGCPFLTQNGEVVQLLGTLAGPCGSSASATAAAIAINTTGKVAGYSLTKAGDTHAVFFSGTQLKDLGTLGGNSSYGYGINDSGQVTGYSQVASGASHAFLTEGGGLTDLGTLGGTASVGYGVNAAGEVTGNSQTSSNAATHAFLYSGAKMHDLGGLGGTFSTGYAINAAGQIVGSATGPSGSARAFLYSSQKLVNLNTLIEPTDPLAPYVVLTSATGISKSGYIAANGTDSRYPGVNKVFLLAPINATPTVAPTVTGTKGQNGWYVSATTLTWTVTGGPPPTTSGCGKVSVPDTTGTTYTCTATNSVGSASKSVTLKKDTAVPTATITTPTSGQIIKLNSSVTANYTCSDATSGIAACSGTVPNGGKIPTSVSGAHTFVVAATDRAGNTSTKSVNYTVK